MKSPIEYIQTAWGIYTKKENFIFFSKIMAILTLVSAIPMLIVYYFPNSMSIEGYIASDYTDINVLITAVVVNILFGLVSLWVNATTYMSILNIGKKESEIFKLGYKKMWKFLVISLVVGLIITFGIILLVIPGIIFGLWYSFSVLLVMDKSLGIKESLRLSKSMVKGKMLKVFGRSVVFGLFTFLISFMLTAVPYAGSLLITFVSPLFLLPIYLLYRDLSVSN